MPDRVPSYRPPRFLVPASPRRPLPEYDRVGKTRFSTSRSWRHYRLAYLRSHPLCVDCKQQGRVTPATDVHHIVKRSDDPELAFQDENCMALCHSCHSIRTRRGE